VQNACETLPAADVAFAWHAWHVVAVVAPAAVEYVPAPQSVHPALPAIILYFPATQAAHGPPSAPVKPTLHVQLPAAELAFDELEFAGHARHVEASVAPVLIEYVPVKQSVHVALPLAILYFPATQATHGPPSGPVKPALQAQELITELPPGDVEFAGHARQVDTDVKYLIIIIPEPPFADTLPAAPPPPPPKPSVPDTASTTGAVQVPAAPPPPKPP
jgi:hypothetical protein